MPFERLCNESGEANRSMLLCDPLPPIGNLPHEIRYTEKNLGQTLADSQRNAVELCLSQQCAIITGGPGVGKTTTLRVILDIYHRAFPDHEILLAAPTGKASRRMLEQTGYPASTLHSALGLICDEDVERPAPEMLSADFVVVDECSMVDMRLAYALFDRLKPGAKLLLVGDPDQLPSVGAGNVLRELIRSELIPTAVLDTVFRQAANSRIALNAYAVNHDDTHLLFGDDLLMAMRRLRSCGSLKILSQETAKGGVESVQYYLRSRREACRDSSTLRSRVG